MVTVYCLRAAHNLAMDVILPADQAHSNGPRDDHIYFRWYGGRVGGSSRAGNVD